VPGGGGAGRRNGHALASYCAAAGIGRSGGSSAASSIRPRLAHQRRGRQRGRGRRSRCRGRHGGGSVGRAHRLRGRRQRPRLLAAARLWKIRRCAVREAGSRARHQDLAVGAAGANAGARAVGRGVVGGAVAERPRRCSRR
ncbi:hypothetical protein H4R19_007324, partial [Coemansia spiralis]